MLSAGDGAAAMRWADAADGATDGTNVSTHASTRIARGGSNMTFMDPDAVV
jgi:hypothetical protein